MKISLGSLVLCLLISSGCYRADTRSLWLEIPEAKGNPVELEALRQYLLDEQSRLINGIVFYQDIRTDVQNGGLEITYLREYLADMNVLGKINQLGYRVNGLPGNAEKLALTRQTLLSPREI